MQFYDEIANPPAPPPPPPPAMPYTVEMMLYASAGPGSPPREWPVKVSPDGNRSLMSEDEIGIWRRVQWLEAALLAAPTEPAPPLPYQARMFTYGGLGCTRERLTKVKPNDYGCELLTPDEIAVWEYVQHLEEKLKAVTIERELSVLDGREVPAEVAAVLTDPIGPDVSQPVPAAENGAPPPVTKRQQAEAELLRDSTRTNVEIGELLNCSSELVRLTRKELENAGRLQPTPVVRRDGTAYPTRDAAPSPTDATHG